MSHDNNNLQQTSMALTHQQTLLVQHAAAPTGLEENVGENREARVFWLNLNDTGAEEAQSRLRILMHKQNALSTDFSVPEGFKILRQQVQDVRLHWRIIADEYSNNEALDQGLTTEENLIQTAARVFIEESPHLLAWFVPALESKQSENKVLLIGSHLVLDEGCVARIREVLIGTRAADAEPEMQYLDYASWISDLQEDEDAADAVSFWRSFQWQELPAVELHERVSKVKENAFNTMETLACVRAPFTRDRQDALVQQAQQLEAEPQVLALTVWAALLQRVSGREQFKISRYHDAREDYEELDDCFGLMQQRLPVPFYDLSNSSLAKTVMGLQPLLEEQAEYQEYVQQISTQVLDSYSVSFQYLLQACLGEVKSSPYLPKGDKLQLQLVMTEKGDGEWLLTYDASKYSELSMAYLVQRLPILLQEALSVPEEKLGRLPCLLDHERELLDSQSPAPKQRSDLASSVSLVSLIRQQVRQAPNAPALRDGDTLLSYAELDLQSERIAKNLSIAGAKPDTIVALCLPRSAEMLIAILAVLKTGAAYLPIDLALPKARLQVILSDAKAAVVVHSDVPARLLEEKQRLLEEKHSEIRTFSQLLTETEDEVELAPLHYGANSLAYLLYTSGSTGKPKGVQITHENILHYSQAAITALQLPRMGHYGLISSLMADLGNTMLFPAWLQGGCVHLIGREESTDGAVLANYLNKYPLDCLKIVPSHLSALLSGTQVSILLPKQVLVLGGERVNDGLFKQLQTYHEDGLMSCKLFNHYGPTETTVGVLWQQVEIEKGDVALANVMGSTRTYLLDQDLNPVISGQTAELYIAGPNLSRGYLGATDLTAARYLPDPFVAGERCYRSGDLAMRRADGRIEIVGRVDQQVKIRGFRLELEEVESLLAHHSTVQNSFVLLQGQGDQAHLVAFAVPYVGGKLDESELKAWLAEQLPDYMVPTQLISVPHLPLNANGKVDGQALLEQARANALRTYVAPRNEVEQKICILWQDILQQPNISVTDKFFDIGGHSLAAIKVVAQMRQIFVQEFPTDLLFRKQSVEALAEFLNEQDNSAQQEAARLVEVSQNKDSEMSLVVMHSHGGHINYYAPLFENIKEQANIYGVLSNPELLARSEAEDLDEVMEDYVQQFQPLKGKKIVLAGWSLASRHMMLLTHRLQAEGFDIRAVAIIDYDPLQTFENENADLVQIKSDLEHYLAAHDLNYDATKFDFLIGGLQKNSAAVDYKNILKQILNSSEVHQLLGKELPLEWVYQTVLQRWVLKKIFYAHAIPVVNVPLWVWCSDDNSSGVEVWDRFTANAVIGNHIVSDHFSILFSQEMAQQLVTLLDAVQSTEKPINCLDKESA